ncbi:hypothetical protein [Streptomyces boncukensis]|uniref:Uncharacterized protein n=1 Tax=Streptomyces boncukensis TaxID=2711219 RepID=A0A6G4WX08_9ACTN|nr:hypothetical protein [Streptomyces boncukensis]NGO69392.1 hypothetical protein [Streptomyces boncukensis]
MHTAGDDSPTTRMPRRGDHDLSSRYKTVDLAAHSVRFTLQPSEADPKGKRRRRRELAHDDPIFLSSVDRKMLAR